MHAGRTADCRPGKSRSDVQRTTDQQASRPPGRWAPTLASTVHYFRATPECFVQLWWSVMSSHRPPPGNFTVVPPRSASSGWSAGWRHDWIFHDVSALVRCPQAVDVIGRCYLMMYEARVILSPPWNDICHSVRQAVMVPLPGALLNSNPSMWCDTCDSSSWIQTLTHGRLQKKTTYQHVARYTKCTVSEKNCANLSFAPCVSNMNRFQ